MLWCGKFYKYSSNLILKKKKYINKKYKVYGFKKQRKYYLNNHTLVVYIPSTWEGVMFLNKKSKNKVIFLCSKVYFFKFPIPNNVRMSYYTANVDAFILTAMYINNYYLTYWSFLSHSLDFFFVPFFRKIKFKGKGYYLYKNSRNTITPQFGHAHRFYLYSFFNSVKFLSKKSIILFGFVKEDVWCVSFFLKKMRPINIFTGRGVRFAKQVVYKKTGKVSTYR